MIGFYELLKILSFEWESKREELEKLADKVVDSLESVDIITLLTRV